MRYYSLRGMSSLIITLVLTGCTSSTIPTTSNPTVTTNTINQPTNQTTALNQFYWAAYWPQACTPAPWDETDNTDQATIINPTAIIDYYQAQHSLTILEIQVGQDQSAPNCNNCGCTTGEVVQAKLATELEQNVLVSLGFTEPLDQSLTLTANDTSTTPIEPSTESADITPEKPITDITDPAANGTTKHKGDDGIIEQTAQYLQQLLWVYYQTNQAYPENLQELDLTGVDLTDISYAVGPTDQPPSYQLTAEYSDSIDIFHPL